MCLYGHSLDHRMFRRSFVAFALLLALALTGIPSPSQATQGSVAGTVKDPNGSVVANATITLIDISTWTRVDE